MMDVLGDNYRHELKKSIFGGNNFGCKTTRILGNVSFDVLTKLMIKKESVNKKISLFSSQIYLYNLKATSKRLPTTHLLLLVFYSFNGSTFILVEDIGAEFLPYLQGHLDRKVQKDLLDRLVWLD